MPVLERLEFFERMKVEKIIGGLIFMHKRKGANWFSSLWTDVGKGSPAPAIHERFETLTFLSLHSPSELLECRFCMARDTGIEERRELDIEGQWQVVSCELVKSEGFADRLKLDSVVAGFIGMFNGQRTLGQIAELVSESLGWSDEEARSRCLTLVRRLLQSSFIKPL